MRCAIKYDESMTFAEQSLVAWGEMQSLNEEPCYKECELSKENAAFFRAFKIGIDEAVGNYVFMLEDEEGDDRIDEFKNLCAGDICLMLFSLLDEQEEEK